MSDTEDQLILEDIRALEDALSQKSVSHPVTEVPLKKEIIHSTDHLRQEITNDSDHHFQASKSDSINSEENTEKIIEHSADSTSALELNQKLIERLMATRNEVAAILEECKRKREMVNIKIKRRLKALPNKGVLSSHAGMPYFKDKDFFSAPANEDTKLKEARGELQIIHLRRVSRWTAKDKETLLKSIHHEVVSGLKNLNEEDEDAVEKMALGKSHSLPAVVLNAIGPLGRREFDWMKIAVTDFQNKHSPEECRVMWNIFLHPDINKFKWKKKELSDLHDLAKKHKYQNWDLVSRELGTQRSGYQCFVKFNTTKKSHQNEKPWIKKEDTKLVYLVNKFRIGDFINWGDIASCMENRTKQQIYFRWMYSLAPHLKKGRFTDAEDKLLIDAIEKYGLNFKKISALVLPARTSAQLSDHYNTIANRDQNVWTLQQDTKLLGLYHEYGNDWAKIATFFDCKSRVQLRHRHSALLRYKRRGIDLNQVPRENFKQKFPNETLVFQKVPTNRDQQVIQVQRLDDIDKQIIDYFHKVDTPPSKAGRRQKFYHAKELESATRKMYNILQLLNAKLNIPYDIDDYECLSEKDKQLLHALKNLSNDATHGAFSRRVEQRRLCMFGYDAQEESEEGEHFIPPLPFGAQVKCNKFHEMINYSLFIDQDFLEDREMTFKTPFNIIEPIGEDVNYEFDKLGELLARPNYRAEKQITNTIYVLTPHELERRELRNQNQVTGNLLLPSTSRASNPEITVLGDYQKNSELTNYNMDNFSSIKPNFWTLLGYQKILQAMRQINLVNRGANCSVFGRKMPEKGKTALGVLRTRLVQLFKYPVIMAQVIPPEVFHEEEIFNQPIKRKAEARKPGRKRKKINENKE